ncbi:MAG: hypothetical protein U0939_25240 [Pirellulales bacterium]
MAGELRSELTGSGRLCVELRRESDRFWQTVWVERGGVRTKVCESREGSAADAWPPSPPLQQLHIEERVDLGAVGLLVGMAGRGHWSLSLEPLAGRTALRWDAACRFPIAPDFLGSTWRLAHDCGPIRLLNASQAEWEAAGGLLRATVERIDDSAPPSTLTIDESNREFQVVAPPIESASVPATARWRFVLEWQS